MTGQVYGIGLFNPMRWGLSWEAAVGLADRLQRTIARFGACIKTKTRNAGKHP